MYLADFHSIQWESKDEDGTIFELGGGLDLEDEGGTDDEGNWGELGDKLATMKSGLLNRVTTGLQRTRKHRTIIHGDFVSSNLAFFPSSIPDTYSSCAAFDFKKAGRGYGVYDVAVLLCESVDQGLLVRDMREEEFLAIYFQHLGSCLRARKKPPLPPGYNIQDATNMYEVCLMLYCSAVASKGKGAGGDGGGYEYAMWRSRQLVEGLEREAGKGGKELSESAWGNIFMAKYPMR